MLILLLEDDAQIATNIASMLQLKKYQVTTAETIEQATSLIEVEKYDLAIVDWMLPDGTGPEFSNKLRRKNIDTPILILTAKSQLADKIEGFESGADDYLTKPFAMDELLLRVAALLRRSTQYHPRMMEKMGELSLDSNTQKAFWQESDLQLSPKEYALLEYLYKNHGQTVERLDLLTHVWGEESDPFSNTVDVHVSYIRKKIAELGGDQQIIETIKGKGYRLAVEKLKVSNKLKNV